jgi:hydroxymethylbilane synthase
MSSSSALIRSLEALSLGAFFLILRSFCVFGSLNSSSSDNRKSLLVGTRTSALALWQANFVVSRLKSLDSSCPDLQIIGLNTIGDVDQIKPLSSFASKGVFTKELDIALLDGRIDFAVHCMKDLPTELPTGLQLSAALDRGQLSDAVVVNKQKYPHTIHSLSDLPAGALIGTSALRRRAQINRLFPHLKCEEIRGNVNTRLRKLDEGQFDAIILAAVGLERLGMNERIECLLSIDQFGYAVGQGALAILTRVGDEKVNELIGKLNDPSSRLTCEAERGLLKALQGGCKVPIAVNTKVQNGQLLSIWGAVASVDGKKFIEVQLNSQQTINDNESAWKWGEQLAEELRKNGAEDILKEIR